MIGTFISSESGLSSGGTISGDLTIDGDLTVNGDNAANISEIVTGDMTITSSAAGGHPILTISNTNDDAEPTYLKFVKDTATSAADNDEIAKIEFYHDDDGNNQTRYGAMIVSATDTATSSEDTKIKFMTRANATDTETLTLESANVGIRTTPQSLFHLHQATSGATYMQFTNSTTGNSDAASGTRIGLDLNEKFVIYHQEDTDINFFTGATPTQKMTITSAGLVGIGVTPEAWDTFDVIQLGGYASISGQSGTVAGNEAWFASNAYYASGWKYIITDEASAFEPKNGELLFKTAASGSADASISWVQNMKIDVNSRISLSNNDASGGASNTIFGYQAGNSIRAGESTVAATYNTFIGHNVAVATLTADADYNTGVGYLAITALTEGAQNVAIGASALAALTSGDENVAIGSSAGDSFTSQSRNTVIGKDAAQASNAGNIVAVGYKALEDCGSDGTVGIGHSAGMNISSGANNVAVGGNAAANLTTGAGNTVLGKEALDAANAGESSNVAIGYGSMGAVDETINSGAGVHSADHNIAIGENSLTGGALGGGDVSDSTDRRLNYNIAIGSNTLNSTGTNAQIGTIAIGYDALTALTTGAGNTAIGYSSMNDIVTGQHNTAVGYASHQGNIDGDYNVCIGSNAMGNMYGAELNNNIAIGFEALYGEGSATCDDTIAIGHQALKEITSGGHNTAIGYRSMLKLTTGAENVAIGKLAMEEADGGESYNVAVGYHAMGNVDHDDSDANVAIGGSALAGGDAAVKNCVAIGYNALDHTAGNAQDGTIAIGKDALTSLTSGASNTAIGYYAGRVHTSGGGNTILGHGAFSDTDAGSNSKASANNTAIGVNAMGGTWANAQTDNCVAIGHSVMTGALSDVDGTVAIGASALAALTSGDGNVAVGYQALAEHTTGANCIAIGHGAMNETAGTSASTSGNNIAIGTNSMGGDWSDTGSEGNVAIGNDTLSAVLAGVQTSIALGHSALAAATSGDSNTAIGWSAGAGVTTGHSNVILGRGACNDTVVLADGTANIVIGMNSRTSATDSANQIVIGHDISGTGDNDFAFGKASNVVHNDFDTDAAWSRTSDARLKTSINNAVLGLDFVNDLRPVTYKWKSTQDLDESDSQLSKLLPKDVLDEDGKVVQAKNTVEHMNTDTTMHGLIAQEVKEALDKAGIDTFKGWSQDDDGVQNISREMFIIPLIKAVQELSAKVEALEKK